MNKTLMTTLCITCLATVTSSYASTDTVTPTSHQPNRYLEKLTTDLQLTPEQNTKVEAIIAHKREAMKKLRTEEHKQIAAILTPEQASKFAKMQHHKAHPHPAKTDVHADHTNVKS